MVFTLKETVPIKYRLGLHRDLPEYPTRRDIEFDLISYIVYVIDVKNKDFDIDNLKFTSKTLKYIFKDKLEEVEFKTIFVKLLKELIDAGKVRKENGKFYILPEVYNTYYKERNE